MEQMSSATLLPEDVIREILLRVSTDVVDLFRCALTCKRWRALLADCSFLRRCWPPENTSYSLVGFFNKQRNKAQPPFFSPIAAGLLGFGARPRPLTSLVHGGSGGILNGASPLTVQSGLIIMHVGGNPGTESVHLALCNPVTGTCDVLPALCCSSVVISRDEDYRCPGNRNHQEARMMGYSSLFKVLAIVRGRHDQDGNIYTFVSSHPNWSAPRKCFDHVWLQGKHGCQILDGTNSVTQCRGVAHWLGKYWTPLGGFPHYYTLDVDVKTGHVSLTKILIPGNQLAVGVYSRLMLNATIDGKLSLLHLHKEGPRLSTWTRGDDGIWLRTRVIELNPPMQVWEPGYATMCWAQKSGTLFIMDMKRCVYKTNIDTGAMENVMTKMFENMLDLVAVPMEIDWPDLFLSRLNVGHLY